MVEKRLEQVYNGILEGDTGSVRSGVEAALGEGLDPVRILNEAVSPALKEVGARFAREEVFLCDLMMAAEAAKTGVSLLEPRMSAREEPRAAKGQVVLGTVAGDIHDIGKTIVKSALEANGFQVIDLGFDVPAAKFVEAVAEYKPDVLGLSALLSVTRPQMQKVIEGLEEQGLRTSVKVVIGGAIVSNEYAKTIHADAYAADVIDGVSLIEGFVANKGG